MIANTPAAPYYAVLFTSVLTENTKGYDAMSVLMIAEAQKIDGYLGIESARTEIGITVSYWRDLASIQTWKNQVDHQQAQKMGKTRWYQAYKVRIAKVERDYEFTN